MSRIFRNTVLALSAVLTVGAVSASLPHFSSMRPALAQAANDGNGPGGGGDPNPPCPDCAVRAL